MRGTTWFMTLTVLAFPLTVQAKGASLADVVSELSLPTQIQPGETFAVAAKIDVAAFCARTTTFKGPNCVADSTPGDSDGLVLLPISDEPETSPRLVEIGGLLTRGTDGVYRGTFKTLPCQKDGVYGARSIDPNPALATARLLVASVATCTLDKEAPRVGTIRLPERVKVPDEIPPDNSTWPRGKLIVEVDDDATGALELDYFLSPADDRSTSYGGATISCSPCGSRWICSADIPLCGVASLGDLAVVITSITDRAGRHTAWWPPDTGPFAVVHCGAESSPDPIVSCPLPTEVDAGAIPPAPDAGAAATGEAGVTTSDGAPTSSTPSLAKEGSGSGCAVAPPFGQSCTSLLVVLVLGLLVETTRRPRHRPRTRLPPSLRRNLEARVSAETSLVTKTRSTASKDSRPLGPPLPRRVPE